MNNLDDHPTEYLLGKEVGSILDANWAGQITRIIVSSTGRIYECTFFSEGGPKTGVFYSYELCLKNGEKIGFGKKVK